MKASELIRKIQGLAKTLGGDPEVQFYSYEWDDDLTSMNYHKRFYEGITFQKDTIIIKTSRE